MACPSTSVSGFHHVSVTVSDLERSLTWYLRVLGLVEQFREDSPERRAAILRLPDGPGLIGLVEHVGSGGGSFDPAVIGLDHFAITIRSLEQMNEWAAHLDSEGVTHSGVIEVPPGAILNFKDPDGIAVALFWDR